MTNTTSTAQSVSAQTGVAPSSLEFFDFLKTQNNELISIIKKTNDELLKLLKSPSPSPSSSSSSSSSPPPPPPPPPPSPSLSYSFESADGVQLSEKNSPWKTSFSEPCYIPYSPENKHPPKISTPYQHYDEFGQKYEDLDQHYMQKRGAYFRDYTVIYAPEEGRNNLTLVDTYKNIVVISNTCIR